jgi:hypothetical protein
MTCAASCPGLKVLLSCFLSWPKGPVPALPVLPLILASARVLDLYPSSPGLKVLFLACAASYPVLKVLFLACAASYPGLKVLFLAFAASYPGLKVVFLHDMCYLLSWPEGPVPALPVLPLILAFAACS